jgi:hypothetical protein
MNSPQFAGRNLESLASRLAASERPTGEVVDQLFLTILTRHPTPAEQQLARDHLRDVGEPSAAYRELAWALLVSSEFSLNH